MVLENILKALKYVEMSADLRTENQRQYTVSMPSLPVSHRGEWTGGDLDGEGRVVRPCLQGGRVTLVLGLP